MDTVDEAVAGIKDGATVLIGGFGLAGMPFDLIDALIRQGATDLTIVANNAGIGEVGLAALLRAARVRKVVCSFPRQVDSYVFDDLYRSGESSSRWFPKATSPNGSVRPVPGSERSSAPREWAHHSPRERRHAKIEGRPLRLEDSIRGDAALISAHRGDRLGNLVFRKTARNFGPVMGHRSHHDDRPGQRDRARRRPRP